MGTEEEEEDTEVAERAVTPPLSKWQPCNPSSAYIKRYDINLFNILNFMLFHYWFQTTCLATFWEEGFRQSMLQCIGYKGRQRADLD